MMPPRASRLVALSVLAVLGYGTAQAQTPSLPGPAPQVPPAQPATPAPQAPQMSTAPSSPELPPADPSAARPGSEPLPQPPLDPGSATAVDPATGTPVPVQPPQGGVTGLRRLQSQPPPQQRTFEDKSVAVLQGLDKITARTSTFTVQVGGRNRFGQLEVGVRACRKAPPIDPPESAAFLEITEQKPGEAPKRHFSGWMFASSPALSAMEHPVYDVWVIDCRNEATSSPSSEAQ